MAGNPFDEFDEPAPRAAVPAKRRPNPFDEFDEEDDRGTAAEADIRREMAMAPAEYDAYIRDKVRAGGYYRPQPSRAALLSDQGTDVIGLQDEIAGAGQFARRLLTSGGSLDEAGKAYSDAAERIRAERRVAREDNGWLGTGVEVVGGLATGAPTLNIGGALQAAKAVAGPRAAQAAEFGAALTRGSAPAAPLGALATAKQAAKAGAGYGAVVGAAQGEGGAFERAEGALEGGLIGGVAGPVLSNVVAPVATGLYRAGKSAARYGQSVVHAARNPEEAAIRAVADQATESGLDFGRVRAALSPPPSNNLAARGFTEADMADVIARQLAGETADNVAASYAHRVNAKGQRPTGKTMSNYLRKYEKRNPTPMNMLDIAVEQQGYQGAMPMMRRARANYGIAPDANIAQTLENRQTAQPGRVSGIIQQSGGGRGSFEDEITRLRGVAKTEENAAYDLVRSQAQPIDIKGAIGTARRRAAGRQGEIAEQMNKAADLFFEPELRAAQQSPMARYRMNQLKNRIDDALARGDTDTATKLQVRFNAMRDQDDFTRPFRQQKVGKPISDVTKFLDARQELDQMIAMSMKDNKATPLTQELTGFRTALNGMARRNNKALIDADAQFHGNRSAEAIIEDAYGLARGLNPRSREAMRDFAKMKPSQQELFRTAFEQRMADNAMGVNAGNNAARQFETPAFRELVNAFYPRSAGADIAARGKALLDNLRRESITTQAGNFVTGRGNSPTAPWLQDMNEQMAGARAASDVLTGRFGRALEWLSDKLSKQIGSRAAAEQLKIVAETNPAQLLPLLNRLEQEAMQSAGRRQLVHDIRQVKAMALPALGGQVARYIASEH